MHARAHTDTHTISFVTHGLDSRERFKDQEFSGDTKDITNRKINFRDLYIKLDLVNCTQCTGVLPYLR